MMGKINFIQEKLGSYGETTTIIVDSDGAITGSCTEIPPFGLQAIIADGPGSKEALVVPLYDGAFVVGYADPKTGKPVNIIDGPYKF